MQMRVIAVYGNDVEVPWGPYTDDQFEITRAVMSAMSCMNSSDLPDNLNIKTVKIIALR